MEKQEMLGVERVCKEMAISEATFINLVQSAGLPAKKGQAGTWEVSRVDFDKWRGKTEKAQPKQQEASKKSNRKVK
jgi:hypothetical protein